MFDISEVTLGDVIGSLPPLVEFDPSSETRTGQGREDLFLCALGFEDRCLAMSQALASSEYKVRRAVYLKYGTNEAENEEKLPELLEALQNMSPVVSPLCCDSDGFNRGFHSLLRECVGGRRMAKITIDISAISSRVILQVISIVLGYGGIIRILYSEPAVYHPTLEEFRSDRSKWLSEDEEGLDLGVGSIVPSLEVRGQHLDQLPETLFLFAGYSLARSKALRNEIDPGFVEFPTSEKLHWFIGIPRQTENVWRVEAVESINEIGADSQKHYVKTDDYQDAMQKLENQYKECWKYSNISIGNFGSKIQTVGIALFCHARPLVRVIDVRPKRYNASRYSDGLGLKWKIELGGTKELSEKLRTVDHLKIGA